MPLQLAIIERLRRGPTGIITLVEELFSSSKRARSTGSCFQEVRGELAKLATRGLVTESEGLVCLTEVGAVAMDVAQRRPLAPMRAAAESLADCLRHHATRLVIAGSIRRARPEVKDIELVALVPQERDLLGVPIGPAGALTEALKAESRHVLRTGTKHTSAVVRFDGLGAVQVDLFQTCEPDEWGMLLFIRTGSADFVKRALAYWKTCTGNLGFCEGLQLHPHAGAIVRTAEEEDVFAALDEAAKRAGKARVRFVPPEQREPRQ